MFRFIFSLSFILSASSFAVLRLGRTLPVLHSALESLHFSDTMRRVTITLSRIASSLYLLVDNVVWLARVGVLRLDVKAWTRLSSRFWLLSLLCNIIRDLYELLLVFEAVDRRQSPDAPPADRARAVARHVMRHERPLLLDAGSNLGDLLLPMSTLTYVNITPGLEGLLGLCSSIARLVSLWNPALKMVP